MSQRLELDTVLGGYRIVKHLGSGGMGGVYEAEHLKLGKAVALKAMHPEISQNEEALARFLREGQAACKLDHPHVVDVFDVGVEDGVAYLVMERLRGHDLAHHLDADARLPVSDLIDLMLPIASALHHAHRAGVVHRDLKPDNVFIVEDHHGRSHPKLLDFGISKVTDPDADRLTKTSAVMGTPYYMSPEQARGSGDLDGRSDQWAFGVILYKGLTGELPIRGETVLEVLYNIHNGATTPLTAHRSELPAGLVAAVDRMMQRDREDRYADLRAAAAALLPFASPAARSLWGAELAPADDAPVPQTTTLGHNDMLADTMTPAGALALSESAKLVLATDSGAVAVEDRVSVSPSTGSATGPARSGRRWMAAVALLFVAGVAAVGVRLALQTPAESSTEGPASSDSAVAEPLVVDVTVEPAEAEVRFDGELVGQGRFHRELVRDEDEHVLRISAAGYEPLQIGFRDTPPPAHIELTALPAAAPEVPADPPQAPLDESATDPSEGSAGSEPPPPAVPRRRRPRPTGRTPSPSSPAPARPEVGANRAVIIP